MVRTTDSILLDDIPTQFAGSLNCAAYIAGIIEGALSAAEFPSTVTAALRLMRMFGTAQLT
jgi:hypothetical protein